MRVAVCHGQVPFVTGGAEAQIRALVEALGRAGHEADVVSLPYKWYPPQELVHQIAMWRSVDLSESNGRPIDAVIGLKYPSYLVRHRHKVVWLMHQYHPAYELWEHPTLGELARHEDGETVRRIVWKSDWTALSEAERLFANSRNVQTRLRRSLGLEAEVLYHRSPLTDSLLEARRQPSPPGDFVLYPSRFEARKRQRLVVDAVRLTRSGVRLVLVGRGPDEEALRRRIADAGLEGRVDVRTGVGDDELVALYRRSLAVAYVPVDEDYGYVAIEGLAAERPVVTVTDAGGPLEFVRDGENGFVVEPEPEALAEALDRLASDPGEAAAMGRRGASRVEAIPGWARIVATLLG